MTDPAPPEPPPVPLPGLDEMADTLRFMWHHFLRRLADARAADPAAVIEESSDDAAVRMRIERVSEPTPGGGEARIVHLVLLTVRGGTPPFRLEGVCRIEPDDEQVGDDLAWQAFGDREELVAWMVPWVWRHVEQGGGWIDFG